VDLDWIRLAEKWHQLQEYAVSGMLQTAEIQKELDYYVDKCLSSRG
jgi:hypothetical protein